MYISKREYKRRLVLVRFVLNYLNNASILFDWKINFDWSDFRYISLIYKKDWEVEKITIPLHLKWEESNLKYIKEIIEEFMFSVYYRYEYDDKPVWFLKIAWVLGISETKVFEIWDRLKKKLTKKEHLLCDSV